MSHVCKKILIVIKKLQNQGFFATNIDEIKLIMENLSERQKKLENCKDWAFVAASLKYLITNVADATEIPFVLLIDEFDKPYLDSQEKNFIQIYRIYECILRHS